MDLVMKFDTDTKEFKMMVDGTDVTSKVSYLSIYAPSPEDMERYDSVPSINIEHHPETIDGLTVRMNAYATKYEIDRDGKKKKKKKRKKTENASLIVTNNPLSITLDGKDITETVESIDLSRQLVGDEVFTAIDIKEVF